MKLTFILISISIVYLSFVPQKNKVLLFNGKNLDGWYTYLEKNGKNNDPDKVFSVEQESIHITGKEFGYLCTNSPYENFKLKLEFKWGETKWPPRENEKRDSGVLYHIPTSDNDKVWPTGVECQIQEGDCGDFWLVGGVTMKSKQKTEEKYGFIHITKSMDAELPQGQWNVVEIIANKRGCKHIINGKVVNEGFELSHTKGKILLQSEGAEIYYRNIELTSL